PPFTLLFFSCILSYLLILYLFLHHPSTTPFSTLSLHDALPISIWRRVSFPHTPTNATMNTAVAMKTAAASYAKPLPRCARKRLRDRKSTRLNSSHVSISYAVFCLKKKNI